MNEEENQAVEKMQYVLDLINKNKQYIADEKDIKHIIVITNLIIKYQKEIEEYRKLRADIIKVNKKIYDVDIIEDMCEQLANSISKDKLLAVFKKYGLDEKECFFSSTSDIIKFVKDMRKLMGMGE